MVRAIGEPESTLLTGSMKVDLNEETHPLRWARKSPAAYFNAVGAISLAAVSGRPRPHRHGGLPPSRNASIVNPAGTYRGRATKSRCFRLVRILAFHHRGWGPPQPPGTADDSYRVACTRAASTTCLGGAIISKEASNPLPDGRAAPPAERRTSRTALRFVLLIGVLSFFADFTYEGSRSILGPYLALLQA